MSTLKIFNYVILAAEILLAYYVWGILRPTLDPGLLSLEQTSAPRVSATTDELSTGAMLFSLCAINLEDDWNSRTLAGHDCTCAWTKPCSWSPSSSWDLDQTIGSLALGVRGSLDGGVLIEPPIRLLGFGLIWIDLTRARGEASSLSSGRLYEKYFRLALLHLWLLIRRTCCSQFVFSLPFRFSHFTRFTG